MTEAEVLTLRKGDVVKWTDPDYYEESGIRNMVRTITLGHPAHECVVPMSGKALFDGGAQTFFRLYGHSQGQDGKTHDEILECYPNELELLEKRGE